MLYKLNVSDFKDEFIENVYRKAMEDLREFFGVNWIKNTPQIFIVNDRAAIDTLNAKKTEPGFVGWANSRNIFLLDRKNLEKESSHKYSDEYYSSLIKHELSHLFYKIVSEGKTNPRWLSEGVAIYASGQIKLKPKPEKFTNFLEFYDHTAGETYAESGFVVKLLVEKFGKEKLLSLIKQLKNAENEEQFNSLFHKIYGFRISYEYLNGLW